MTQLAGEIADGAILNGLLSPQYTRGMVDWIKKGAGKNGALTGKVRASAVDQYFAIRR